ACSDELVVFDTGSWRSHETNEDVNICEWHPREPWLLRLEPTRGELYWTDLTDIDRPRTVPVGSLGAEKWVDDVAGFAVDATGKWLVVARIRPDRLEWWECYPLRLVESRPVQSGEVIALEHGREAGCFAAVTRLGAELWGFESREPISDVIRDVSEIKV